MSIKSVTVQVSGTNYSLDYNETTGKYEAVLTAPYASSFLQPGGFFPVTVSAENSMGNIKTISSDNEIFGDALKLYVKERIAPTLKCISNHSGDSFCSFPITLTFSVVDKTEGQNIAYSGINPNSVKVYFDSVESSISSMQSTNYGYIVNYVINNAAEGDHSVKLTAYDNDGNYAKCLVSIKIDRSAPSLFVSYPDSNIIVTSPEIIVTGSSYDNSTETPTITITCNAETVEGEVEFISQTVFEKTVELSEGLNVITVTASDEAGNSTSVTRNVMYDSNPPVFRSVTMTPNHLSALNEYQISIEVE